MIRLRRFALPLLPAAALVLEALPFGVRMLFAPGPETRIASYSAFFSFLPFGYGVFGPVIAALLTVLLLVAALLTRKQDRVTGVTVLSAAALTYVAALFTSVMTILRYLALISRFAGRRND